MNIFKMRFFSRGFSSSTKLFCRDPNHFKYLCEGWTKKDLACRNVPLKGENYCGRHIWQDPKWDPDHTPPLIKAAQFLTIDEHPELWKYVKKIYDGED